LQNAENKVEKLEKKTTFAAGGMKLTPLGQWKQPMFSTLCTTPKELIFTVRQKALI
jgi:hypothetical protein